MNCISFHQLYQLEKVGFFRVRARLVFTSIETKKSKSNDETSNDSRKNANTVKLNIATSKQNKY